MDMSINEDKEKLSSVSSKPNAFLDVDFSMESVMILLTPLFPALVVGQEVEVMEATPPDINEEEVTMVFSLMAVEEVGETVTVADKMHVAVTGTNVASNSVVVTVTGKVVTVVNPSVETGTTLRPVATTGGIAIRVAIWLVSGFGKRGSIRGIINRCFQAGLLPILLFPFGKSRKGFGTFSFAEPSSFVLRSSPPVLLIAGGFMRIGTSAGRRNLGS